MYRKKKDKREQERLNKLDLVPNWPMYQVVVPGFIGIYDDIILATNDARGSESFHFCTKNKVTKCIDEMEGYYKYHYPDSTYSEVNITKKNTLFKV